MTERKSSEKPLMPRNPLPPPPPQSPPFRGRKKKKIFLLLRRVAHPHLSQPKCLSEVGGEEEEKEQMKGGRRRRDRTQPHSTVFESCAVLTIQAKSVLQNSREIVSHPAWTLFFFPPFSLIYPSSQILPPPLSQLRLLTHPAPCNMSHWSKQREPLV